MGPHSGKFAVVNGQSTVRNWSISDSHTPQKFVASNTQGGTGRRGGISDWTGSFAQYGGLPTVMPGEAFSFSGYTAPDNDTAGSTGTVYNGPAIVDSVVINWNWENGEIVNSVVNFAARGLLVPSDGAAALTDSSAPNVPTICGTKIMYGSYLGSGSFDSGSGAEARWKYLASATLTIMADNQSYVNSETACGTGRSSGVIDWSLAVVEQETRREHNDIQKKADLELKLFIDAENYWDLQWGQVQDFTNITADRESGAVLSRTVNLNMNGFPSGSNVGRIRKPGSPSTNWWPAA